MVTERIASALPAVRCALQRDLVTESRIRPRFSQARFLAMLGAEVTWVDRRSGQILHQQTFPVGPQLTQQASNVSFAPEVGHSLATAQQEAAQRLASRIVASPTPAATETKSWQSRSEFRNFSKVART